MTNLTPAQQAMMDATAAHPNKDLSPEKKTCNVNWCIYGTAWGVEAASEEEARQKVLAMEPSELIEGSLGPSLEAEVVSESEGTETLTRETEV